MQCLKVVNIFLQKLEVSPRGGGSGTPTLDYREVGVKLEGSHLAIAG